jgi:two-component system CheB/CheR fusion protein
MTDHSSLIVGVGASAGGLQAFKSFFSNVSADSGMTFVAILHLSPEHDSNLAEILQGVCPIPVSEVAQRIKVEPNHVYVVSPRQSLAMADGHLVPSPTLRLEERRAPIDIFFRTLAESHRSHAACAVLSGSGADGSMGLKTIKEYGGICLVQDPAEAEFSEMPRSAIATGLADATMPAAQMPSRLLAYQATLSALQLPEEPLEPHLPDERVLHELFGSLRTQTGHDFSNYKRATVLRRIARRMGVRQAAGLQEYLQLLHEQPEETQALLKDLLISVTNFFRDGEAFAALEEHVIPKLFRDKGQDGQVRVWVPGCATGEEAYSIAMLLTEFSTTMPEPPSLQVFATDIDEQALATAREGLYTINDAADVSPERLRRFFTKEGDRFQVRKELREAVLFARHNLLKDPPFSHLDLVSCRNLMIYLNRAAQQRVIEVLHFALEPRGFLFLGTSEAVEGTGDLFVSVHKDAHIFQSRGGVARLTLPIPPLASANLLQRSGRLAVPSPGTIRERLVAPDLHQRLLEQYAAPSIVVNEEHEIVHLSDRAGRFLQVGGGEPTHSVVKAVRPELRLELRTALYQAAQHRTNVEARGLPVRIDERDCVVDILVRPVMRDDDPARGFFLVLFEEGPDGKAPIEASQPAGEPALQMEEELSRVKAQLRSTVEQYETQAEELKASNEELQAINEELRSASEELETSKEELQSVNEELRTVNQELKVKIEEQTQSTNDVQNLINSTDIGTVFLDRMSRIKLFTPRARDIFSLIAGDRGRPLDDISSQLLDVDLHADVGRVLDRLERVEREVTTKQGKWYLMRIVPYRTSDDRIDGVVFTFVDITEHKSNLERIRHSEERLRRALDVETVGVIFFSLDSNLITDSNEAFMRMSGYAGGDVPSDRLNWEMLTPPDRRSPIPEALDDLRRSGQSLTREVDLMKADGSPWVGLFTATKLDDREGVAYIIDVTDRRRATDALQDADRRKNEFLATLAHELRNPLAPIVTSVQLLKAPDLDAAISHKAFETIERQVNHLVRLAEDLVEVSRITLGKVEFIQEVTDLRVIVSEALDAVANSIQAGKYQVAVEVPSGPMPVMADPARLMQVFVNLLNNALKYTPGGGRISITATADTKWARVSVQDNGIGISEEVLPYVFDLFTQGSRPSERSRGGLGVGLALVRTLVQGHNGRVSIRSDGPGKGTEVMVELPLTRQAYKTDVLDHAPVNLSGQSVLIVDDNRDAADSLGVLLSRLGANVDVAYSGHEALALVANQSYVIAFVDLGMPELDGFEVARTLRKQGHDFTLVALTGWGQERDRSAALAAGFNDHLTKPASLERLSTVLQALLGRRGN